MADGTLPDLDTTPRVSDAPRHATCCMRVWRGGINALLRKAAHGAPMARHVDRISGTHFSNSGKIPCCRGSDFRSLKVAGITASDSRSESGDQVWLSGPRMDGNDRKYGGERGVIVGVDVEKEHQALLQIRKETSR